MIRGQIRGRLILFIYSQYYVSMVRETDKGVGVSFLIRINRSIILIRIKLEADSILFYLFSTQSRYGIDSIHLFSTQSRYGRIYQL